MSNASDILEAMNQATYALEALPIEEWGDWVIYLLENLEEEADDKEFRDFLEALELAIITRLEEGSW